MSFKKKINKNLWVLIPAYNEEKSIKEVINRTKKFVSNILIINDGSTDNTHLILNKIKNIEVINILNNSGKANALKLGMEYLKKKDAKRIITIDGDLQHLPEEIPFLLEINADLVIGARKKLNTPMPIIRKIGNYLASKIILMQLGIKIKDPQSGFRIYNQNALNELNFEGNNFNIEKKTLEQACKKKLSIKEVPISCIYNIKRKSYFKLKDAIEFLKN
ncbi:MAG: glycosyltransferase family 2 protein [Candidatus Nanoarchaeia archaeon]|nr:glycosyltransferase family 2 protein [Candidatus Nanoarchaeia archaeon]